MIITVTKVKNLKNPDSDIGISDAIIGRLEGKLDQ